MVQPPKFTEEPEVESKTGMKMPGGSTIYIVMVVVAIIAAVGVNYFMGVPKSSLDTQLKTMNETITSMQSDLRASKDSIKLALDGIGSTVDSKVQSSLNSITNQINSVSNSLETIRTNALNTSAQVAKIDLLNPIVSDLSTQVTNIKKDIVALQAQTHTDLQKSLTDALGRITLIEASITKIKDDVAKLTPATTVPTTTTTTTPTTGLTATVVGATSMPLVSGTNTINIILSNNTLKALYAEQINVQLQFLNPPTNINTWGLSLSSTAGSFNSPSYAIVNGMVTYLLNAGVYMSPSTSQTISVVVNSTSAPASINFVVTLTVNGYSALQ
jgi:archaellum component FlaC